MHLIKINRKPIYCTSYLYFRYTQTTESVSGGERSNLIIDKAERKDSALITCTASNGYGEDSINIQVTVQGKKKSFSDTL